MNLVLYAIITLLVVILAIIITIFVLRQRYQARLLESGGKLKLLEDASKKTTELEAELRVLLPYQTLAQEREKSLELAKKEVSRIQAELTGAVAEARGFKTRLDQQQLILEGTFKKMEGEFQILSQKMLEDSSLKLSERSKESLKTVLEPLTRDLGDFKKRIDDTHIEDTKQRSSLQEQVRILADLNQKISLDAENLTKALKGDAKTQGTWGEMVLEKVLEASGLRKGEEYELQSSFKGPDGNTLRPDVVVRLPEKRDVIVDAKVSLLAYDAFIRAETDGDRLTAAADLALSIQTHIKGLSAKAYQNVVGIDSIDIVVMFIANEGALSVAAMNDHGLLESAVRHNVMLASPTTLLAVLKGIEYGWRSERQNQNVQLIFKAAGDLYDKFSSFALDMDQLGSRLDQAHLAYDAAKGKLQSGKGNLVRRVEKLRELGAKSSKNLPTGWGDGSEMLEITDAASEEGGTP